ncbi:hypothetical protein H1P_2500006 [Hyella patelloides LEGE 07179]|uniref:Uncharacterized protein n=1 Tax=Hyella patelloides LEGE 07179 TaxID=945734 RepID=A0A563VS65_9CYAN|nr:hypothetical protein [Hyella patelloides]VEP14253.1 hypothetical protein H1P_2500006 [Hyella patelloides LEGE 07179]
MNNPIQDFQHTEQTRNRLINQTVKVFTPPPKLDSLWIGVNSVITVFRHGTRDNQDYQSSDVTFYLIPFLKRFAF